MTNLEVSLISASALLSALAFFAYFRSAVQSKVRPNRWSWIIWTFASGVEVFTYQAIAGDAITAAVFWFSFVASLATTMVILANGVWRRPNRIETICAGVSLASLALALGFDYTWGGHLLVLLAIPLSFGPTYASAWRDHRQEDSVAWVLWTFGDFLALCYVLTRLNSADELAYPVVEMVCHGAVWVIVLAARAKARLNVMATSSRVPADQGGTVTIGRNHLGEAVFAARAFAQGDLILQIKGDLIPSYEMPERYHGASDRYMQVDSNLFIGPSGGADDLVNHSCDPNSGIRFTPHGMLLIALRTIAQGEEICWDYSTTMQGIGWSMRCDCRTTLCRGEVAEFSRLGSKRQAYYVAAGVVAPFIEAWYRKQQHLDVWRQDAVDDASKYEPSAEPAVAVAKVAFG